MLIGKRARLRAVERADLPSVTAWFNDAETRATLSSFRPRSLAEEERWFEGILASQNDHVFIIDVVEGATHSIASSRPGRAVGICGIHRIDWKNRSCLVGIMIGDAADRGRGLGTDAMHTLVGFAHGELAMVRVELEVFPHNLAAVKSYERLGFVHEGKKRSAYFRDGKFHDFVLMSCLPGELLAPPGPR